MSLSLDTVIEKLHAFIEAHSSSTLPGRLNVSREELLQVLATAMAEPNVAAMQEQIAQLSAQVSALQAALDASTSARHEASPVPAAHSSLPSAPPLNQQWIRDIAKFNGEGYDASREFLYSVKSALVYVGDHVDRHKLAVSVSGKFSGAASVWYNQFTQSSPGYTIKDLVDAFKKRYVSGRKAQAGIRDAFFDVPHYETSSRSKHSTTA